MKKQNFSVKCALGLFIAWGTTLGLNAQITETMGTTGPSTETIAARETANRFDEVSLTYSGTADVRNTTPSTGYSGASGGYNVLIQAQETFQAQVINAASCDNADSLIFGVFKSTNASTGVDFLVAEYSSDNGSSWNNLPFAALPTGSGTSRWYRRAVALPTGAHVANLTLRFRSTLVGTSSANPQFRIDDVQLTCGSDSPCDSATTTVAVTGSTVFCSGQSGPLLTATTDMDGSFQWHDQSGPISGATGATFTPSVSGSYFVVVSNENGCESVSGKVLIYVYPKPSFCEVEMDTCSRDTVEICVAVNANDLFFSQYVEGDGFNKYLEIYNGTCDELNLGNYQILAFHNGAPAGGTPTYIIPLSGPLVSGGTYVVAHPSATAWSGTPNLTSVNAQWNGDDALVLFNTNTGTVADVFGSVGHDPGSSWRDNTVGSPTEGWSTENKTLVRKSYVYSGILENPDLPGIGGFPYLFTEWDTLANNDITGLGTHAISATGYSFAVTSGSASIVSSSDNCFLVVPGTGLSTISVDGDFGPNDDCEGAVDAITLNGVDCGARSAAASSAGIRHSANTQATAVYPNPFTDAFTVSFTNAVAGEVSIQVVDMYGKSLSILNNQRMEAGTFNYSFDASTLAAGTYLCRIQTANGQETVRIIKSK